MENRFPIDFPWISRGFSVGPRERPTKNVGRCGGGRDPPPRKSGGVWGAARFFAYQRRCCHCSLRVHTRALVKGQGKTAEKQGYMKIAYWANSGPWNIIPKGLYWFVPVVVYGICKYAYERNCDRLVAWGNVTSSTTPLHPVHQLAFSHHIFTYQRRCCHCSLRVHTRALGPQRPEGQGKTAEEQGYMKIAYWANSGPWNIILKELY